MPIDYVAYNQAGARVTGVVEVETEREAEEELWASGLVVVSLAPRRLEGGETFLQRLLPRLAAAKINDAIEFTRQLETLLRAGISLHPALRQLREESRSLGMRYAISLIVRDIEGGERFSRAVAKHPKIFPPYYIRMMPMAEETGQLAGILKDLLHTMERQRSVQAQARRAIMTPAISLVVGFLAAFILFTFVLPRLVDLLGEFGTDLPLTTRLLVGVADFSRTWGIFTVTAFVAVVVVGTIYLSRTSQGRKLWDSFLLRAPVVGPVVRASTMFDVCSMYSLLLQAGVAPVVGLRAVTGTIGNIRIREAFIAVDHEVTQGQRLGLSLLRYPVIPRLFSETVHNGEQAGALEQNLRALADFYQDDTERRVESGTSLIEPLAFLVVGTLIGFIAVAIISGIYSVIPQIGLNA